MLVVGVALLIVATAPRPAEACSCAGPRTHVSPTGEAPTNTRFIVWIPDSKLSENMSPFALRGPSGKRLDVDEKSVMAGEVRVVELVPRAALSPKTAYEVLDAANHVVGRITTTDGPRTEKVEWRGIGTSEYAKFKSSGGGSCMVSDPFIRLTLAKAIDPKAVVYFAVWVAGKDGKIDYTAAPSTYASARGGQYLVLGRTSICGTDNFTIPKGPKLKLGIKMLGDTAATSTPAEITLDVSKPVELGDW
jgi:hypothetical protein